MMFGQNVKQISLSVLISAAALAAQPKSGAHFKAIVDSIDIVAGIDFGIFNLSHTATRLENLNYLGSPIQPRLDFKNNPLAGIVVGFKGYDAELLFSHHNNLYGKLSNEVWVNSQNGDPIWLTSLLFFENAVTFQYFFNYQLGLGLQYKSSRTWISGPRNGHTKLLAHLEQSLLYLYLPVRYRYKGLTFQSKVAFSVHGSSSIYNQYDAWFTRFQTRSDVPDPILTDIYIDATGTPRAWFIEIELDYVVRGSLPLHLTYSYEVLKVSEVYHQNSGGLFLKLGIPFKSY